MTQLIKTPGKIWLAMLLVMFCFAGKSITADAAGNVYQKLQNKEPVRVAVLGDSIGAGAGSEMGIGWVPQVGKWMQDAYGSNVTLDNYSVGGTTSFYGYFTSKTAMQANVLRDGTYDLVMICYGQNDGTGNFSLVYEALLREVKMLNPACQMITLLEHSQRGYTSNIKNIMSLSRHYDADVVDTIAAFANSGYTYEQLSYDEVHPNDAGHLVYRDAVNGMIHYNVTNGKTDTGLPAAKNQNIHMFDSCEYVSIEDCSSDNGIITVPVLGPTVGVVFSYSPDSKDINLHFSNGQHWFGSAYCAYAEVQKALLANLCVPQGTVIRIDDRDGKMKQTIQGFVFAGSTY